jgi:MFS family permease
MLGKEHKGFAISLYLTFFDVGMVLGPVIFGWISDLYGYRLMYIVAGSMSFLMGLLFTWKTPSAAAKNRGLKSTQPDEE